MTSTLNYLMHLKILEIFLINSVLSQSFSTSILHLAKNIFNCLHVSSRKMQKIFKIMLLTKFKKSI